MAQRIETKRFDSARGIVTLVVLGETKDVYLVCSPEEHDAARREGRSPRLIGFRRSDVVK